MTVRGLVVVGLAALAPAAAQSPGGPVGGAGCAERRPAYGPLRQEEDWTFLADPACRADYADPAKHVALGRGASLSVGGEARSLVETVRNGGGDAGRDDAYLLQRTMLHAGIRIGPGTGERGVSGRVFVQLKSGLAPGLDRPAPPDRDALDVGQAFAEGAVAWGGAGGRWRATARAGRLELHYGAGRLVSVREGPNVRSSYDGGLIRVEAGDGPLAGWAADAFAVRPKRTRPGAFDDADVPGAAFAGVYTSGPVGGGVGLDVYGFADRRSDLPPGPDAPAADETRLTLGVRAWVRAGPLQGDVEAAVQGGRAGTGRGAGRVRAWLVSASGSAAVPGPWAPALGLYAEAASGDGEQGDGDRGTWRAPFPSGRYFDAAVPFGPANLVGVRPSVALRPAPGVAVGVGAYAFWRARAADGLYSIPGAAAFPARPGAGRFAGWAAEAFAVVAIDGHVEVRLDLSHFRPGPSLGASAAPTTYLGPRLTYVF